MVDLTAIILTKNESKNIVDCLKSIKGFAKRAVVVDSGSTDDTIEIAKNLNANVYFHKFENYARQFNWAIDNTNIDTKWTLRLDADERLTPLLCKELEQLMEQHDNDDVNGITMEAWYYFLGRCIKHGGSKKRKLMVFKTGIGRIEDRKMDEHTILSTGRSVATKERFLHYDFRNIDYFISKMNWYATREMQDYFEFLENTSQDKLNDKSIGETRKKKFGVYYRFPIFFRSWLLFIYFYIFKLGFLDGKEGFIYHYMYQRWYRCLVDAKIYEQLLTNKPFEETGDLKV
ncbi:glycosyltransferase family 2 protein [Clostridium folliculivorans]|uniref:glycosyltransferase family 2 protein n=1 Tax=Clostridium folliculivorans TaxID=2886038 RepID=UPI0021C313C7|nr:glycosyltransferase family 2 protein [Clostridium folliculivorans]GKU31639.1 glycosyl transferase [Clostridium folliculivorans]